MFEMVRWVLGCAALVSAPLALGQVAGLEKAQKARTVAEALAALGVVNPEPGKRVLLEVPDIALEGKPVSMRLQSQLPGTDWMAVLVERNDPPLVEVRELSPGAEHELRLRLELKQTGRVRAVVRAAGKYYEVAREVKLATPGCGDKKQ